MKEFLKEKYNLQVVEIKTLGGYDSENYCVKTADKKYVLKIYKDEVHLKELLSAENRLLQFLSKDRLDSYLSN
jgi:Ser/Thr protein kinase RdoA (MazF antagonist)